MAKTKVTKRSKLTATKREQVRRVKERLAGDKFWKSEIALAYEPVADFADQVQMMVEMAEDPAKLRAEHGPAVLRRVAQRMRAIGEFSRLVGAFNNDKSTIAEHDAAWDRWHVRFERALRALKLAGAHSGRLP